MKQHAHLLILTIMFLTSCSDDTEVMKQESSPPSLTEKAPTYRTKENAIIEVELFIVFRISKQPKITRNIQA